MRTIRTEHRNCDICGSCEHDEISSYSTKSRTKSGFSLWTVRNVVCHNCGFAFVSPAPLQECLNEHYMDSFELSTVSVPDYSIEKRIKFISKFIGSDKKATYLEIGSNNCPLFLDALNKKFASVFTLEINQSCSSSYSSWGEMPEGSIDLVAVYFVLEHVPAPIRMLETCAKIVSENGIIIIEIPNLYFYPDDPAGLYLWEHVNHFSPTSLISLAGQAGLELVEISNSMCSRPFGFVAAFKRSGVILKQISSNKTEYLLAKKCMESGAEKLKIFDKKINTARAKIIEAHNKNQTSILWVANGTCLKVLDNFSLPSSVCIVDSDIKRKNFLPGVEVHIPSNVTDKIASSSYLVINSPFYAEEIKKWIKEKTGKSFDQSNSIVIDYFEA